MSRLGITAQEVYDYCVNGLPRNTPQWRVTILGLCAVSINAAENKVELDLDILIGEREVRCIRNQEEPDDDEDTAIIYPPLDKPKNWFAGDREGILKLPKGPCKRVIKVTVHPYGFLGAPFEITNDDVSRKIRWTSKTVSFVPGQGGNNPASYFIFPVLAFYNPSLNDNTRIPGGIEITYRAGLSKRQITDQYPLIRMAVIFQAAILALSLAQTQAPLIQKESASNDGMQHSIELPSRSTMGVLGGEIKNLSFRYDEMIRSLQGDLSLTWVWL